MCVCVCICIYEWRSASATVLPYNICGEVSAHLFGTEVLKAV